MDVLSFALFNCEGPVLREHSRMPDTDGYHQQTADLTVPAFCFRSSVTMYNYMVRVRTVSLKTDLNTDPRLKDQLKAVPNLNIRTRNIPVHYLLIKEDGNNILETLEGMRVNLLRSSSWETRRISFMSVCGSDQSYGEGA